MKRSTRIRSEYKFELQNNDIILARIWSFKFCGLWYYCHHRWNLSICIPKDPTSTSSSGRVARFEILQRGYESTSFMWLHGHFRTLEVKQSYRLLYPILKIGKKLYHMVLRSFEYKFVSQFSLRSGLNSWWVELH